MTTHRISLVNPAQMVCRSALGSGGHRQFGPQDGDSMFLLTESTSSHGAKSQKFIIIIVTAVKASNLIFFAVFLRKNSMEDRFLIETLIISQLVKFIAFLAVPRFAKVFSRSRHWTRPEPAVSTSYPHSLSLWYAF
jgi:hypothetical protein